MTLVCWAYLGALSGAAPLGEFPPQAFILPAAAAEMGVLMAVRSIFYLVLAHKLKKLANSPDT